MTHKIRVQRRALTTSALLVTAAVTMAMFAAPWAMAQTQVRGRTKPKPAPTAAVASSVNAPTAPTASVVVAAAASGPVPVPRADLGDGGVRPSPLNPAAEEMPASAASAPVPAVDYDKLLGDIAALRARVADVGDALFVSRIVLSLETDGDHAKIGHLTISLDDGIAYTAPSDFRADDAITVYEHAVAPGHHAVTVEVDRKDDRDDTFRDTQKTRFIVDVPKDSRLAVTLRVGDDSNMGKFPGEHTGKYDLRVRMKATASAVKR